MVNNRYRVPIVHFGRYPDPCGTGAIFTCFSGALLEAFDMKLKAPAQAVSTAKKMGSRKWAGECLNTIAVVGTQSAQPLIRDVV